MSLFNVFDVAASAMQAQSDRLNTVASNLANIDSVTSATGESYRAKQVLFEAAPVTSNGAVGVKVKAVVEDNSPPIRKYEPGHPLADKEGYVTLPNIKLVDQMVNMISASRSYQTNVDVFNEDKAMVAKTLTLGQ